MLPPLSLRRAAESGALMREKAEQGLPREAEDPLGLWSPTFFQHQRFALARNNFPMVGGGESQMVSEVSSVHLCCALTADLIGGGAQAVM